MTALFVIQIALFQFSAAPAAASPSGDREAALAAAVACHTHWKGERPTPYHEKRCTHCPFCNNGSRGDVAFVAPLRPIVVLAARIPAMESFDGLSDEPEPLKPPGWTSSWSSRAPPSFA